MVHHLNKGLQKLKDDMVKQMITNQRPNSLVSCKFCQSTEVVRNGLRKGTQYWLCKNCGHGFVDNHALPKMKYPMSVISKAVYDYYGGMSLNSICEGIGHHYGTKPSDSVVFEWVRKLTKVAENEANKYAPEVGEKWIADETVLKIGGKNVWMYDVIDEKTRYLLATRMALTRTTKDAQILFERATKLAGKIPKVIVTDKNNSYVDGIELAYGMDSPEHIQTKPFTREENTELIERFHGTLKDRTKVMRGLKNIDTAIEYINGWLIFYNYFRPHESLEGKTPAEVAKIKFSFENWQDVINSLKPLKPKSINPEVTKTDKGSLASLFNPKPYRKRVKVKYQSKKRANKKPNNMGIRMVR